MYITQVSQFFLIIVIFFIPFACQVKSFLKAKYLKLSYRFINIVQFLFFVE